MKAEEARRLKEFELEKTRLERVIAGLDVDNQILKETNRFLGKLDGPHNGDVS